MRQGFRAIAVVAVCVLLTWAGPTQAEQPSGPGGGKKLPDIWGQKIDFPDWTQGTDRVFSRAYNELRQQRIRRLKLVLREARKTDADKWSEIIELSEKTGLSTFVVEHQFDNIKEKLAEQEFSDGIDFDDLHDQYPATAEFLSESDNARFAHRDLERLKKLEKGVASGLPPQDPANLNFSEKRFDEFVKSRADVPPLAPPPEPDVTFPAQKTVSPKPPEQVGIDSAPEPFDPDPLNDKDDDGAFGA